LLGHKEELFPIREILERSRNVLVAELDHAHSLEEAKAMLQPGTFNLVLFEHDTGDAEAVHLVAQFLHAGVTVPFILLTENADETTVAEIIQGGTWYCVARSQLE
jgi:DNA-binding NtrC family response regulator